MAETIGQLALRIADGMPDCCNDQSGFVRIYEFEPQELETFAQALVAQGVPDGWKLVIDPSRDCVLSNDDYHEAEIIEMGKRLFSAVDAMCAQAGTETNETVEWLCGEYGGMAKLFLKYFSPASPAQGQEDELRRQRDQLLEALKGILRIHEEPAGFEGKYGRELDKIIEAQQVKIDAAIVASRAAIAAVEQAKEGGAV